MTSWKATHCPLKREGQHEDGIYAAKGMTKGARHADVEGVNAPGSEKHLCKGPEAAVSWPCLETRGGAWLLEHGTRAEGILPGVGTSPTPGGWALKSGLAALQVSHLGQPASHQASCGPYAPCHRAPELTRVPRWVDILASGQGRPLRPRHISGETTAHKLFPVLYGDPAPPPGPAQGRPGLASPSPTVAAGREAALGWAAIGTFYEHISVSSPARRANENFCLSQLSWLLKHSTRSSHGSPFSKNCKTIKCLWH